MSRIDFAYGAAHRLRMACHTTAKHVRAGRRLLVWCTDTRRMQAFDQLLWSFEPNSFIPHVGADDLLAAHTPVLLLDKPAQLAAADRHLWLLNLDLACPPLLERYQRILEIVSTHPDDIKAAKQRWVAYRQAGHELVGHQIQGARI